MPSANDYFQVSQLDEHYPFLTVRETLTFVARNALAGADEAAVTSRVDDIMALLHLKTCEHTIIGDDLARGVSGGEKKRVTIGEGIITAARFLALDEISTGLDSSVTFDVVKSLRTRAREQGLGVIIALLQPTPETVALFDDIILMREGAVIYHGPRVDLAGYMTGLGFLLPPSEASEENDDAEDLADWLSELVTFPERRHHKDLARIERAAAEATTPAMGLSINASLPSSVESRGDASTTTNKPVSPSALSPNSPPMTTEAFKAAWMASPLRALSLGAGRASVSLPPLATPAAVAQWGQPYVKSAWFHASSLLARQARLLTANSLFMFVRIFSAFFMAIVFGGLYYQGDVDDGLNKYGFFLNCVMQLLFTNISEMSGAVEGK